MHKRLMQASMLSLLGLFGASAPAQAPQEKANTAVLVTAAETGGAKEALAAAEAFEESAGGAANLERAAHWYGVAADRGSGAACLRLGLMSENGDGLSQSFGDARASYEKAVALGCEPANLRLGFLYLEGWGVKKDEAKAAQLIKRAADSGYTPAQRILSDMYAIGAAVPRNLTAAQAYAEKAAADDDAQAEERLGSMILVRSVTQADRELARNWLRLSSDKAYDRAQLHLAMSYLSPHTSEAERKIGVSLLTDAALRGNADAQVAVALFLSMGRIPDPTSAQNIRKMLTMAAKASQPDAVEVLDMVDHGIAPAEAFRRLMTQPYEERYILRYGVGMKPDANGSMQPSPIVIRRPSYPMALRLTGVEGSVVVQFVVDTKGNVLDPRVVQATHPGFAESALATIVSWKFRPGVKNGRIVNTRMQVPILYQLHDFELGK